MEEAGIMGLGEAIIKHLISTSKIWVGNEKLF